MKMSEERIYEQFLNRSRAIVNFVQSTKDVVIENGCLNYPITNASLNEEEELVITHLGPDGTSKQLVFTAEGYRRNYGLKIDRTYKTIDFFQRCSWMSEEEFLGYSY